MCLQMNLVYQAVIEEKLQELEVLIAQNKEQQVLWGLLVATEGLVYV